MGSTFCLLTVFYLTVNELVLETAVQSKPSFALEHVHTHPQQVSSSHKVPQITWHLPLDLSRKLEPSLSFCTIVGAHTSSGWRVAEWTPYAWKHSLMILASSRKLDTDRSEMTTCTEARDFCWLRRQIWSSWIERTPGIYSILGLA